jgi:hypothetical protein
MENQNRIPEEAIQQRPERFHAPALEQNEKAMLQTGTYTIEQND